MEKLRILAQAIELKDAELGAFLREQGLHRATLVQWQAAVEQALGEGCNRPKAKQKGDSERKRIKQLEGELARKDKALADIATLQMLKKKYPSLWGEEE